MSPEAYQAGLQWAAAGAHPAGARQQGFGAWAAAPGTALGTSAAGVRAGNARQGARPAIEHVAGAGGRGA